MTLTIKSIEIDEYKQITKVEFGEGSTVEEITLFLNNYGIANIYPRIETPIEKPTTLWGRGADGGLSPRTDFTEAVSNKMVDGNVSEYSKTWPEYQLKAIREFDTK